MFGTKNSPHNQTFQQVERSCRFGCCHVHTVNTSTTSCYVTHNIARFSSGTVMVTSIIGSRIAGCAVLASFKASEAATLKAVSMSRHRVHEPSWLAFTSAIVSQQSLPFAWLNQTFSTAGIIHEEPHTTDDSIQTRSLFLLRWSKSIHTSPNWPLPPSWRLKNPLAVEARNTHGR